MTATFTFSGGARRAGRRGGGQGAAAGRRRGSTAAQVRLEAGPGVAQVWTSAAGAPGPGRGPRGRPDRVLLRRAFEVVRDYLLSLPGLPASSPRSCGRSPRDGSTLPLPVPGRPGEHDAGATSAARRATVLPTRDRALAAVVWVEDGVVTAVAGSLDADEVLAVARGLR